MPQLQKSKQEFYNSGNILSQLLQSLSNPPQQGSGGNRSQRVMPSGKNTMTPVLPYQEGVNKALKQLGEQHVVEAVQSGMSPLEIQSSPIVNQGKEQQNGQQLNPTQILSQLIPLMSIIQNKGQFQNQSQIPEQNQIIQENKAQLLPPSSMFTQSGITPQGDIQQGGFFNFGPNYNELAILQKLSGQEPMQTGEQQKLEQSQSLELLKTKYLEDRQDQREILKSQLTNQYGADNPKVKIGIIKDDLSNFIQSWENLPLKGRVMGPVGAVGRFAGQGREKFAEFEANAETLSFSFSEFVLNQKGRALTDKERETIKKKIINAGSNSTKGDFYGKMNSIIQSVNARIKATNLDADLIPDIRKIIKKSKSSQSFQSSNPSGIKSITQISE